MRDTIKNSVMALIAAVVLIGDMAHGQGTLPQRRAVDGSEQQPITSAKLSLAIGDKLKISFYETIDIGATKQSGQNGVESQVALRTFYQRMDLTGDYSVEQDGVISIPLLGRFQVEGRALDDVRSDLAVSFTAVIGRSANIDVKIFDRSPIYVVGPVKNSGAYKYVPGMIVLHAIALAGGLDQGEGSVSGMIEGTREMERLRSMTLQVQQLLARRARLEAERDGVSTLPIPIQLAELARERPAGTLFATESTILSAEQARGLQQRKEIALRVAAARNEVEALKRKLEQIDVRKDVRIERLNEMQKLKNRGLVTNNNVDMLRTELSDIEPQRQDTLVAILQAEARLTEAEEASARLSSESTANLANAIATIDKDIAAAQEGMISASALAMMLHRPNSRTLQGVVYEIVRQSKDGAGTLQATETSPLLPGDVLKINPTVAAINPSSVSPVPQSEPTLRFIHTQRKADLLADALSKVAPTPLSDAVAQELAAVRAELADRVNTEAATRNELADSAKRLEANEKQWTAKLNAERERSNAVAQELAAVRAGLADRVNTEAAARNELADSAKRLEANEKQWTAKLNAERERSNDVAQELAAVRAGLADRVNTEAGARKELADTAKRLEANEKQWAAKLNAERERSNDVAQELAAVRAELADRVNAEAGARKELADSTKRLEAKEKQWAAKRNAERERSNDVAPELAAVRAELADRVNKEAVARKELADSAKRLEANEKQWAAKLNAERERSNGMARDLVAARAELAERVAADQSARTANELTATIATGSTTTDQVRTVQEPLPTIIDLGSSSISSTMAPAADETRLIARAQFLIGQGDVAAARQFLQRAVSAGSARAAFLLAETYDKRLLQALQAFGVIGDTKKALEFYGLASRGGIDNAKERMSALESTR